MGFPFFEAGDEAGPELPRFFGEDVPPAVPGLDFLDDGEAGYVEFDIADVELLLEAVDCCERNDDASDIAPTLNDADGSSPCPCNDAAIA